MIRDKLLSSVRSERPVCAWEDRWPADAAAVISGRGGAGKSSYAQSKLAAITTGTLPGIYFGKPQHVAIIGALEDGEGVAKLRIQANGGNPDLVHVPEFFAEDGKPDGFSMTYLSELHDFLKCQHIRVAMIDQLNVLMRDQNKASDIARVLPQLNEVARSARCAIVGINHFRKGAGMGGDLMAGSAMLRNNARSLILIAADGDERVATLDKFNLSREEGSSWKFRLQSTPVATDDGGIADVACVEELGPADESVEQVVSRQYAAAVSEDADPGDAGMWLLGYLDEHGGEAPARDIFKAARADGIPERTLQRSRTKVGVESVRRGFGNGAIWLHPDSGMNGGNGGNGPDKALCQAPIDATGGNAGTNGINALTRGFTAQINPSDPIAPFAPPPPTTCQVCGQPLDASSLDDGFTTCPSCEMGAAS